MTTPLGATLGFPHVIRSQFKIFVVAKCLNCSHTDRHTRRPRSSSIPPHLPPLTPSVLRGMRTSALNFAFGTRLNFPHIGHPRHLFLHPLFFVFVFPHHSLTDLFSPSNQKQKKKKKPGRRTHFLPLKNKLNGKKKKNSSFFCFFVLCVYIYIFVFQIQGTMSICIPIRLHSQVQCANMASHEPDCLLIQLYISPVCTLNTVIKRCVCFG